MPKEKKLQISRLLDFVLEFGYDVFYTDHRVLFYKVFYYIFKILFYFIKILI